MCVHDDYAADSTGRVQSSGFTRGSTPTIAMAQRSSGRLSPRRQREIIDGLQPIRLASAPFVQPARDISRSSCAIPSVRDTTSLIRRIVVPVGTGVKRHVARRANPGLGIGVVSEQTFGERLRTAVENAGLTQGEVARRLNALAGTSWTAGYVGRLMKATRPGDRVDRVVAFALPDLLGVEPRWLWTGVGRMSAIPAPEALQKVRR